MTKRSMFVGMDVHKESIDLSIAEEGRDGEVRPYGAIPGDLEAVAKVEHGELINTEHFHGFATAPGLCYECAGAFVLCS
jgi:transposase